MIRLIMLAAGFCALSLPALAQGKPAPAALTLDQAIAYALDNSPALAAQNNYADAAKAKRSQAGAFANPELEVEVENIYGDADGTGEAEITYGISQLVELPGKRGNRIRMASAESIKADLARDAARIDLIRDVTIAYAEVVAGQKEVAILEEERNLADQVRDTVAAKVQAGKEPPIQKNKAGIELSASEIALDRASRSLNAKRQALAALMGGGAGNLILLPDSLPPLTQPEDYEVFKSRLSQTPEMQSLEASVTQAQSALSLEKANALPDPTLGLGVKESRADDTESFVASLSFPIPVFNLNRAGIARAGHELNASKMEQQSSTLSLETALAETYGNYVSAYSEAMALKATVLPGAEEAFAFARGGYDAGKFGYLEVLDAQRTLFGARRQYNEAILDYYTQRTAIERLTALHAQNKVSEKE